MKAAMSERGGREVTGDGAGAGMGSDRAYRAGSIWWLGGGVGREVWMGGSPRSVLIL